MFNFHKDHRALVRTAILGFVLLSTGIAIIPASQMQDVQPLPDQKPLSAAERRGLETYISEGCVACHTQQVRGIEMDKMWGDRPSIPSDYFYSKQRMGILRQSPSLLGSERTGPDLTNIGKRQPGIDWHLIHLYNPRAVVGASVMPSYPWLFEAKDETLISEDDVVVAVGKEHFNQVGKKVVATEKALDLVAYLQSLQQAEMPSASSFIPMKKKEDDAKKSTGSEGPPIDDLPDGENLYMNTCAACHQATGKGLPGAFPPLAGSSIVNDEDPETLIRIILQGYDARPDYGLMPSFAAQLNDKEITAIINHERSSWGNNAKPISVEEVTAIRELVMSEQP
ncbi:MAG: cytochrome c [Flavobacteriales bacterium]|nr:cytochrome c [Flavobacteriales bacterium]